VKGARRVALLLDEMFAPAIAIELTRRGFDVLAAADDPNLRSMNDGQLLEWAEERGRILVTENVKDFRPLLSASHTAPRVLFTSSRTFSRSRRSIGLIIGALEGWLQSSEARSGSAESWLQPTVM